MHTRRLTPALSGYPHARTARRRHVGPLTRRLIRMERRLGALFS